MNRFWDWFFERHRFFLWGPVGHYHSLERKRWRDEHPIRPWLVKKLDTRIREHQTRIWDQMREET